VFAVVLVGPVRSLVGYQEKLSLFIVRLGGDSGMRSKIRTLSGAMSTLVILFVLVLGASLDASAQGNSRWGRSHNRGRHLGWTQGRRVGQNRNNNFWRRRELRRDRRELRSDRRELRRDRRDDRRDWRRERRDDRRDHR
jgi:hypothetical protein